MENDFYFIVLKELIKGGILKTTDLSIITADYLSDQRNVRGGPVWADVDKIVKELFDEFVKNGHIKSFTDKTPQNLSFDSNRNYASKIQVSAEISLLGFSFYKEQVKNIKTLKYALWAICISFLALLVSLIILVK